MRYRLTQGEFEDAIVQQSLAQGMPVPDTIADQPVLLRGLELYMDAFQVLSSCRSLGQGMVGPIPWTAIDQYARHHRIKGEESRLLLEIYVQKMDAVYVKHLGDEMAKKNK